MQTGHFWVHSKSPAEFQLSEAPNFNKIGAESPKDIEILMKNIVGYSMGLFQIADLVRLDVMISVQSSIYEGSGGSSSYKLSHILSRCLE